MVGKGSFIFTFLGCTTHAASGTTNNEVVQDISLSARRGVISPRKSDVPETKASDETEQVINAIFQNGDIKGTMNKAAELLDKDSNSEEVVDVINRVIRSLSTFERSSDYSTVDEIISNQVNHIDSKSALKSVSAEPNPYIGAAGQQLEEIPKTDSKVSKAINVGTIEAKTEFARYGFLDKRLIATITNPDPTYRPIEPTSTTEQVSTSSQASVETSPNRSKFMYSGYEPPKTLGWPISDSNNTIGNQTTSFSLDHSLPSAFMAEYGNRTELQNESATAETEAAVASTASSSTSAPASPTETATGSAIKNTVGAIALLGGAIALALI